MILVIDDDTVAVEQVNSSIAPGDTITYTFSNTFDLSSNDYKKTFQTNVYIDFPLDDFTYNNSYNYYIQTFGDYTDEPGWTNYNSCDGTNSNNAFAIAEDGAGNIWTTEFNGASMFDGTSWTTYTTDDGLAEDYSWDSY